MILDFFSEVFAVAPNLFLPIKTKTLIQLNPVILTLVICHSPLFRTNIHFTWFFPFFFSRFTSHNSHSVIPNSPLIRSYFCRRIREGKWEKKKKEKKEAINCEVHSGSQINLIFNDVCELFDSHSFFAHHQTRQRKFYVLFLFKLREFRKATL